MNNVEDENKQAINKFPFCVFTDCPEAYATFVISWVEVSVGQDIGHHHGEAATVWDHTWQPAQGVQSWRNSHRLLGFSRGSTTAMHK